MSQKLRISQSKIKLTLDESLELKNIENAIERLSNTMKELG